ncbi:hypothetical protein BBP40_002555 [Aspergillus hancockii]|nr:hypothetical protein BBP40_002555 [Aspergillus hancockii]
MSLTDWRYLLYVSSRPQPARSFATYATFHARLYASWTHVLLPSPNAGGDDVATPPSRKMLASLRVFLRDTMAHRPGIHANDLNIDSVITDRLTHAFEKLRALLVNPSTYWYHSRRTRSKPISFKA